MLPSYRVSPFLSVERWVCPVNLQLNLWHLFADSYAHWQGHKGDESTVLYICGKLQVNKKI